MEKTNKPFASNDKVILQVDIANLSTGDAIDKIKKLKSTYLPKQRPSLFAMLGRALHTWHNWDSLTIPSLYTPPSAPARERCITVIERVTKVAHKNNIELSILNWFSVEDNYFPLGVELFGWHPDWIDVDYNKSGIRLCFAQDNGYWLCSWWDNEHDRYETSMCGGPAMFALKPEVGS